MPTLRPLARQRLGEGDEVRPLMAGYVEGWTARLARKADEWPEMSALVRPVVEIDLERNAPGRLLRKAAPLSAHPTKNAPRPKHLTKRQPIRKQLPSNFCLQQHWSLLTFYQRTSAC